MRYNIYIPFCIERFVVRCGQHLVTLSTNNTTTLMQQKLWTAYWAVAYDTSLIKACLLWTMCCWPSQWRNDASLKNFHKRKIG